MRVIKSRRERWTGYAIGMGRDKCARVFVGYHEERDLGLGERMI